MELIIVAIEILFVLIVEKNLKLRQKYQQFSSKFTKYYIDFIMLLITWAVIGVIIYLLTKTLIPSIIIAYLCSFALVYSLFIILPIKFLDDLMEKIFK